MDEDTFRRFYERTAAPLLNYLLRVSGRRDVADDLLQESYCRLLSAKIPQMDEGETKGYLFRIATNLLRDRWRGQKDVATIEEHELAVSSSDPAVQTDVRRAMQQLSVRDRQLLWLAYVEGAIHKEISAITGLRSASVRLLLFRARRRLLEKLGREKPKKVKV
jgi:RNA polymerase sigma-70 factor (ECF subfamily)